MRRSKCGKGKAPVTSGLAPRGTRGKDTVTGLTLFFLDERPPG